MALRQIVFEEQTVGVEEYAVLIPHSLRAQLTALPPVVGAIVVTDDVSYQQAGAIITEQVRPALNAIREFFTPLKRTAKQHHQALCDAETSLLNRLQDLINYANAQCTAYRRQQEETRRAAEAVARAEAERQAEALRLAEAEEFATKGDAEAAERLLAEPPPIAVPVVPMTVAPPTAKGVVPRVTFTASGPHDLRAFYRWIAEDPAARAQFAPPSLSALNKLAAAQRRGFNVPGWTVEEVQSTTFRAQRAFRGEEER